MCQTDNQAAALRLIIKMMKMQCLRTVVLVSLHLFKKKKNLGKEKVKQMY